MRKRERERELKQAKKQLDANVGMARLIMKSYNLTIDDSCAGCRYYSSVGVESERPCNGCRIFEFATHFEPLAK